MKSNTFYILAVVLIVTVVTIEREPFPADASAPPRVPDAIRDRSATTVNANWLPAPGGTVQDVDGTPLHGVEILIEDGFGRIRRSTDASGRFSIPAVVSGTARVSFRSPGLVPAWTTVTRIARYREVTLRSAAVLSGIVVTESDQSVEHATIEIESASGWNDVVEVDPTGHFTASVPPGMVEIACRSPRHGDRVGLTYRLAAHESRTVRWVLEPGREVVLRITDRDRRPLSGARVSLETSAGDRELAMTGRDGRARFPGVHGDRAMIAIARSGFAEVVEERQLRAATGSEHLDFVLPPASATSFEIVGADLAPVIGAELRAFRSGVEVVHARSVDDEVLGVLQAGRRYRLELTAPNHVTSHLDIDRLAPHTTVQLLRGYRLRGRLVDETGRGASGESVRVVRVLDDGVLPVATLLSDATGCFETKTLPAGCYRVEEETVVLEHGDVDVADVPLRR